MRAEDFRTRPVELAGWQAKLTSYFLNGRYIAEVEVASSGVTIARTVHEDRRLAETEVLDKAASRLQHTRVARADLTVGG